MYRTGSKKRLAIVIMAVAVVGTGVTDASAFGRVRGWLRSLSGRAEPCPCPCPTPLPPLPPNPNPETLKVRRNVRDLSERQLSAFKRGVAAMKALSPDDPRSWSFQASIHGTVGPKSSALFNQCEHGTVQFLTWHRAYLHYFERILREMSGDPDLTLPYWDWTVDPALPEAFRLPADSTNPLFEPSRMINDGSAIPAQLVSDDLRKALALVPFRSTSAQPGFSSALENGPHDNVHVQIGGLMSQVPTAANDPMFWLHHCNIDRLWDLWLQKAAGRMNPTDSGFLDKTYSFVDENGAIVTGKVRDTIASKSLGYRYDSTPAPALAAAHEPPPVPQKTTAPLRVTQAGADPGKVRPLGLKPVTESLTIAPLHRATVAAAAKIGAPPGKPRLILQVEGLAADAVPEFSFGVYLNVPANTSGVPDKKHYVGSVNFFGKTHTPKSDHGHKVEDTFNAAFDVTELIRSLQTEGKWQPDAFTVTFVPLTPLPPPGAGQPLQARLEASSEKAKPRYQSIHLNTIP